MYIDHVYKLLTANILNIRQLCLIYHEAEYNCIQSIKENTKNNLEQFLSDTQIIN